MKNDIKENSFEGGVGGSAGTLSYGTGYGTFASQDVSQNPGAFSNSNNNKAVNQNSNTTKTGAPTPKSTTGKINALFSKKDTPTPDEIVTGIKYEIGHQIKKNKQLAKQTVLDNLRKDPHFYSALKMLNIDDKSMIDNMNESKHPNDAPERPKIKANVEETKKIFAAMSDGSKNKYVVNSQISDVMKQMWEAKQQRSAWKNGK